MSSNSIEKISPKNQKEWRQWLETNHRLQKSVWLISYKKSAKMHSISWSDTVDEALCFGWIDSVRKTVDEKRFMQFYSQRKPKSTWSKINKEKVAELISAGKLTKAGMECIEIAKANGSWEILDSVEALIIPPDLEAELKAKTKAFYFFLSLSNSKKKILLSWIVMAKRQETRQKRIAEIALSAEQNQLPKQFQIPFK